MKKKVLDYCINSIRNRNDNKYDEIKLAEIRYGLEAIYLTFFKMIIIFIVALILGIFKEMIIIMLLYNILRTTGGGIHATKSWICLVSSLIVFIGIPYIAINIIFPFEIKILICSLCVIAFFMYAPADTKKRPIIKAIRRKKLKIVTVITSLIYTFLCLYIDNIFLSNALMLSMIIQSVLILPVTYSIFKLPYNNYKNYVVQNI